ncbi:MAG: tetratricopeptide repeat protein, partial [Kiritimatiellae bacterium]|nr:tetratricopeptide repeat protein [Kiritimatiellia bacterium]
GVLTPREGLVIGLARADFALAGRYAAPILAADPDDPRANFAMGMMYYTGGHYARAEKHLLRCLVRRPDDAAVLNNLALAQLNAGRLAEAETNAARAMARLPDSPEIRKTMRRIEEKKRKASLR